MSNPEEATVNPDGSTTFSEAPPTDAPDGTFAGGADDSDSMPPPVDEETMQDAMKAAGGIDPAFYVLIGFVIIVGLYYYFFIHKKSEEDEDEFFTSLDGEKFNLKLPAEVDEYYEIKEKCLSSGWEPGQAPPQQGPAAANSPARLLAQALMKRAIADIPIVTHIQKESSGMNRLYSQSMCSVKQWRSYQAAEAMVSSEVEEVRAEADEIEPGWSNVIWRQAMQYHTVLKQKHEMEAKAAEEQAKKRKEIEMKVQAARSQQDDEKEKELAAERAAQELLKEEEREKNAKKAFAAGKTGMKKGFLDKGKKK
jgi:hypothetical protein